MKKTVSLLIVLFFSAVGALYAQSADKVTEMLDSKTVTYGQVSYFAASYLGLVNDNATQTQSLRALQKNGIIPPKTGVSDTVVLGNLAYICARTWNVHGGIFYTLFNKAPRYAFRELKAKGIIQPAADPDHKVSGRETLNIITACMDKYTVDEAKK